MKPVKYSTPATSGIAIFVGKLSDINIKRCQSLNKGIAQSYFQHKGPKPQPLESDYKCLVDENFSDFSFDMSDTFVGEFLILIFISFVINKLKCFLLL